MDHSESQIKMEDHDVADANAFLASLSLCLYGSQLSWHNNTLNILLALRRVVMHSKVPPMRTQYQYLRVDHSGLL